MIVKKIRIEVGVQKFVDANVEFSRATGHFFIKTPEAFAFLEDREKVEDPTLEGVMAQMEELSKKNWRLKRSLARKCRCKICVMHQGRIYGMDGRQVPTSILYRMRQDDVQRSDMHSCLRIRKNRRHDLVILWQQNNIIEN
jgi:hypothetical protein